MSFEDILLYLIHWYYEPVNAALNQSYFGFRLLDWLCIISFSFSLIVLALTCKWGSKD